jgi:hypothetical protein
MNQKTLNNSKSLKMIGAASRPRDLRLRPAAVDEALCDALAQTQKGRSFV